MLNKLRTFLREQDMLRPGDRVIVAISGGADSVALLLGLYLLRKELAVTLEAAHFNHGLRGAESDGDEAFVTELCGRYDVPLHLGRGQVVPGEKGLEAAARDARYAFLRSLGGKIATAHTADDNLETVLMHLVRGTGLKGLGGIAPVGDRLIRPMLTVTREEVEAFLEEYCQRHITDSSNLTDRFFRNRLRHQVVPLLKMENPRLAENVSAMALRLRQEESFLAAQLEQELPRIPQLRTTHPALRSRYLERFLKRSGVPEPEQSHIALAEQLVFSDKPSARGDFPGGIRIRREYDRLMPEEPGDALTPQVLKDRLELPQLGLLVTLEPAREIINTPDTFTLAAQGEVILRPRQTGDSLRLRGGSKTLKKRFIDRKIPASQRDRIPVLADELGILGVYGFGADLNRIPRELPAITIRFIKTGG